MSLGSSASDYDYSVAKTTPALTYEDESVQNAGDNTRRRLAAANSRNQANSFWTSVLGSSASSSSGSSTSSGAKTTTG